MAQTLSTKGELMVLIPKVTDYSTDHTASWYTTHPTVIYRML